MARIRRCRNCGEAVRDDGYGVPVHEETNKYSCQDGNDEHFAT